MYSKKSTLKEALQDTFLYMELNRIGLKLSNELLLIRQYRVL
jgi:hypothetical protein